MRAIDDLASEPSARYFYKGFNEIVHDENTVIELLEKDFILAAGNKETCKRIGEVQERKLEQWNDDTFSCDTDKFRTIVSQKLDLFADQYDDNLKLS